MEKTSPSKMVTMMAKPIRLKKQKQIGEQTLMPYQNLEEGMEVSYLPAQSKSEDTSSSLVCYIKFLEQYFCNQVFSS